MDLSYSPEELAFRNEVRDWLSANLPQDIRDKVVGYQHLSRDDIMRWHRILAKKGWSVPHWPVEWGGTGWDITQRYIFNEEFGLAGAPTLPGFGPNMCASVLLRFGTDAQKNRHLPRIRDGEDFWVQGYSEPGSGSDLASLKTRADRKGDHYVVNGQKIWTTLGHYGDWIFCLVRTDPGAAKRQEGISFLLIDMKTPGITVRPLILMDGGHEVNEVFFDDVKVPAENLIFEENKGWTVAKYLLGHERMGSANVGASKRELAALRALAAREMKNGRPLLDDPRFRDRLTRVEIELQALELTAMRFLDKMRRSGQPPGADVSMLKLKGSEVQQAITELMMQAVGPQAQPFVATEGGSVDAYTSRLAPRYFNYRKTTIYAGSNEIQRNIIAKATLGREERSMNFEYSEEQQQLADSLRKYLSNEYDFEKRKAIIQSAGGVSDAAWSTFAELGLTAIALPEADGGFGGGAADLMGPMEACGEALVVEPLLDNIALGARLVSRAGSSAQRTALLPGVIEGRTRLAFAGLEPGARYELIPARTQARASGSGWVLDGEKTVVVGAPSADTLIVSARTGGAAGQADGVSLFLVPRGAAGVTLSPCRTVDGQRAADVRFSGVQLGADALLGTQGAALALIEEAVDFATALLCADAIGTMKSANDATLEYLKTRKQFGVAIGSFQALQHRMVDMYVVCEQARSMAILAATRVDAGGDAVERKRAVSAAKIKIADAARQVSQESVQLHGGMGMTEEMKVSHSFRRLTMIAQRFGDADHHLERYAALS